MTKNEEKKKTKHTYIKIKRWKQFCEKYVMMKKTNEQK